MWVIPSSLQNRQSSHPSPLSKPKGPAAVKARGEAALRWTSQNSHCDAIRNRLLAVGSRGRYRTVVCNFHISGKARLPSVSLSLSTCTHFELDSWVVIQWGGGSMAWTRGVLGELSVGLWLSLQNVVLIYDLSGHLPNLLCCMRLRCVPC